MIAFAPFAYFLFAPFAFIAAVTFYFVFWPESRRDRALREEERMIREQAKALGRILSGKK